MAQSFGPRTLVPVKDAQGRLMHPLVRFRRPVVEPAVPILSRWEAVRLAECGDAMEVVALERMGRVQHKMDDPICPGEDCPLHGRHRRKLARRAARSAQQ